MAGNAHPPLPYRSSPALAHAAVAGRDARHVSAGQLLLLGAALAALFALAAALIAPQVSPFLRHATTATSAATMSNTTSSPPPTLTRSDLETVASYAGQMRADDTLVQVRPGVFAKRSNVEGVQLGGRTVYYDILPHQSFGPLRSGKVAESQVNVLTRETSGDFLLLVYTLK